MTRPVLLVALVSFVALGAGSCSKPDGSTSTDVSVAPSTSVSAAARASATAAQAPPADVSEHEECHVVGAFTGLGSADTVVTFHPDATGDWSAKSAQHFVWALQQGAAILTFESPQKGEGPFGCAPGQVGRYKLTVEGCKTIKLELVEDACVARAKELGKAIGTRKKREK